MKVYEKVSLIKCNVNELFSFHLDTNNLKNISPANIKVTLLNEDFVAKEGEILRLKTVKNFIPMVWEVKIEKLEEPNLLVDLALKSPFKYWRHSHIFTQKEDGFCELRDVVEYSLPFEFISQILYPFVHGELESMFAFRHTITKKILEG